MKVSELAKSAGVNPQTVRYYEREGLLEEPARDHSGYREYDESAAHRLRFICEAKKIGFTLREIRELMGLESHEPKSCGCVQTIVETKLKDLEERLKAMRRMKKLLQQLHGRCSESDPDAVCPVLEILDSQTPRKL
jgi:Hg(II)-responsive transcriptional regulator